MTKSISDALGAAFAAIGAVDKGGYLSGIKIKEVDYPLAESFQVIFSRLGSIIGPVFSYDRFQTGEPADYHDIRFSSGSGAVVPIDLSKYPCTQDGPYVGIAENQYRSHYVIRLDDPEPADPQVYFIDHDDWDGTPSGPACRLSEFLTSLKRKEEC